jgi:hypothetical protein
MMVVQGLGKLHPEQGVLASAFNYQIWLDK